jgi:hypothetical protein
MSDRNITTVYYGPSNNRDIHKKPIVKRTRSSVIENALPNAVRHMAQNDYGATVCSIEDDDTGQLLGVITYKIGETLKVHFEADVDRPLCLMKGIEE